MSQAAIVTSQFSKSRLLARLLLTAVGVSSVTAALGQDLPAERQEPRRHSDGPLEFDEFQADVGEKELPGVGRAGAYTAFEIRYSYRYKSITRGGRTLVWLSSINVYAVFRPQDSWLRAHYRPLLDHEQGHFDLTETIARRAQLHLAEMTSGKRRLEAVASTEQEAERLLHGKIKQIIEPYVERARTAHTKYDQLTSHGSNRRAQTTAREEQLTELEAILDEVKKHAPARRGMGR